MTGRSGALSDRIRVKRVHERGAYDRATIDAILDAAPVGIEGHERSVDSDKRGFRQGTDRATQGR